VIYLLLISFLTSAMQHPLTRPLNNKYERFYESSPNELEEIPPNQLEEKLCTSIYISHVKSSPSLLILPLGTFQPWPLASVHSISS